jgi:hypothetical protein
MKWFIDPDHNDPHTTLWVLSSSERNIQKRLAKVQVFKNKTACYWFLPNSKGVEANSEERAKQLAFEEVVRCMAPVSAKSMAVVRAPFEINRLKLCGSWIPRLRSFRTSALFYSLFELFKFDGEGFLLFTLCIWYRAFQIQFAFPARWIKKGVVRRLPKHQLLTIRERLK